MVRRRPWSRLTRISKAALSTLIVLSALDPMIALCLGMMFFMMRGHRGGSRADQAGQILKERSARGEIDKSEYEERRRVFGRNTISVA
jgi:uncharacterized membrane protein